MKNKIHLNSILSLSIASLLFLVVNNTGFCFGFKVPSSIDDLKKQVTQEDAPKTPEKKKNEAVQPTQNANAKESKSPADSTTAPSQKQKHTNVSVPAPQKGKSYDTGVKAYKSLNFGDSTDEIVEKMSELGITVAKRRNEKRGLGTYFKNVGYHSGYLEVMIPDNDRRKRFGWMNSTDPEIVYLESISNYLAQTQCLYNDIEEGKPNTDIKMYIYTLDYGLHYMAIEYRSLDYSSIRQSFLQSYPSADSSFIDKNTVKSSVPYGLSITTKRERLLYRTDDKHVELLMPIQYEITFDGLDSLSEAEVRDVRSRAGEKDLKEYILKNMTIYIEKLEAQKDSGKLSLNGLEPVRWELSLNNPYLLDNLFNQPCKLITYSPYLIDKGFKDLEAKLNVEKKKADQEKQKKTEQAIGF